jgi:hypothetical protein
MLDLTFVTVQSVLTVDLGLVEKPKLLSMAQKDERVQWSEDFIQLLQQHSLAALNNIVTMDESAMSFLTPEMKRQSKQWVKKGQSLKAKVHASRTKQMVLIFFDAKGIICMNFVPKGKTVNASYIGTVLAKFF